MSGENTDTKSRPPAEELTEREVLFNAYFDGELSDEREAEFDRRLETDREFREAYDDFSETVEGIRNLPYEFAPEDFTDRLQDRVRRRSNGGFFSERLIHHQRAPYEAIAIVMFLIMVSAYLLMILPQNRSLQSAENERLEVPPRQEPVDPPNASNR